MSDLHSICRMVACFLCFHTGFPLLGQVAGSMGEEVLSSNDQPVVTSLHELDIQGNERIRDGVSVELKAYVTYHDPDLDVLFVEDDLAGIYVETRNQELSYLPVGSPVRIHGKALPGVFRPYLSQSEVVSLEEPLSVPKALEVGLPILETGRHDGQMVLVRGRVRSLQQNGNQLNLELLNGRHKFTAFLRNSRSELDAQTLIDSVVQLSGACGFDFDGHKLLSVRLYLDNFHQLVVEEASQTSFSMQPVAFMDRKVQEESEAPFPSRTLLHGVYLGREDENLIYFQTPHQGFMVELPESDLTFEHGDPVGILGWVRMESAHAAMTIEGAQIRGLSSEKIPGLHVQETSEISLANLNRWLNLKGTLADIENNAEFLVLHVETGSKHVAALVRREMVDPSSYVFPQEGSLISIQGVLTGLPAKSGLSEFISLKVLSIEDIQTISPPSWWTIDRIVWLLAGAGLIGIIGLGWSFLLNRRVKQQTSALRRTLEQERLAEERYRKIFESALDMIVLTDHRSNILSINPAGAALLEVDPSEIQGKCLLEWVFLEDRSKAKESFGLGTKTSHELYAEGEVIELRFVTQGGERVYVELSVRGVLLSGETHGYQCIARNIDARKQSEAHLIKARNAYREANRAKSSFLAMMSHELRTPMNGVMGMTQMLQQTKLDSHQKEIAQTIQTSSQAMMKLLLDLLDISRIEADQLKLADESFDLVQVVEDAIATLYPESRRKELELTLYIRPKTVRQLKGDPSRIRQILLNLVGNAIKFTESGGVSVRVYGESPSKTVHQIRFEIVDTGVGLGGLRQQDLFEAFVQLDSSNTRKFGGAGLGLSICKRIVQAMGGVIGVEGQTKQGAVFWFEIPFKLMHAQSAVRIPPLRGKGAESKVLVISSNALVHDYYRMRFKDAGIDADHLKPTDFFETMADHKDALLSEISLVVWDMDHATDASVRQLHKAVQIDAGGVWKWVLLTPFDADINLPLEQDEKKGVLKLLKPLTETSFQAFCDFMSDQNQSMESRMDQESSVDPVGADTQKSGPDCTGLKVLVAEDDVINQKLITLYLKKAGCQYDLAPDGQQVIKMIEQQSFDVVLMDCSMPVMDGFEATRRIRSDSKFDDLKVIALTAHSLKGDRERCIKAGMDDYMAKPLNLDLLTQKLSSIKKLQSTNGH